MPFTNHVTDVSAEPVTVALNCCEPPIRTLAELGEIETAMPGGGELVPPDLPEFTVNPTQPTRTIVQTRRNAKVRRRTISLRVYFEGKRDGLNQLTMNGGVASKQLYEGTREV